MTEEKLLQSSEEIDFSRLETITHQKPFDVFYMTETSQTWHSGGFSFHIGSPSAIALLSRDVWVEYNFYLLETQALSIADQFQDTAGVTMYPLNPEKFCFRGGNVIARSIKELTMNLNGTTFYYYPAYYMDVWNRIHVSNQMSEHEFSGSGGKFDDGNHGHRTDNVEYAFRDPAIANSHLNMIPNGFGAVSTAANAAAGTNTRLHVHLYEGFLPNRISETPARDFFTHIRAPYPLKYEYYNPGFSNRYNKFSYMIRNGATSADENMNAAVGLQFSLSPSAPGALTKRVKVTLFERMPIPIFKMYMLDGVEGVIPNIYKLTINAMFVSPLVNSILHANFYPLDTVDVNFGGLTAADCKMHIKWYIPTFSIPRVIKFNSPKFATWMLPITGIAPNAFGTKPYADITLNVLNITLPAIPDVMFIYLKYDPNSYTADVPDDYNLEILNSYFTLNAADSKTLNMKSIQMYALWKNHLKYSPENAIQFDEWRKYCFTLVLKPEDFGIKRMSEYNDTCVINFKGTARNWYVNPSIQFTTKEVLGGAFGTQAKLVFVCHAIYYRNILELSLDKCLEYLKPM